MERIVLKREKIHSGNLILVNRDYPIVRMPEQENVYLRAVDVEYQDIQLESKTVSVLQRIMESIDGYGKIIPVSGYRSLAEQKQIYRDSLRENGSAFTSKFVAMPNHSEHQTGLAIDLGEYQDKIDFICPDFPYEGICQEFREEAYKYGFIERYQKDKEEITKIGMEPWHFRYVGYPHSMIMKEKNFCLEEYIEFLKNYRYGENGFAYLRDGQNVEIYFVEAKHSEVEIEVPDDCRMQVSGNNVDGFILTIWRQS